MHSHFFAYLARMKFIKRWGLMKNTMPENIQEHSLQTAMIAHMLAVLRNARYGGHVDPERAAVLAMYHDVSEVFTGDMPTPVKYFNEDIRAMYGTIEQAAVEKLFATLPADLRDAYRAYILTPEEDPLWELAKAADTLSAYLKCVEERTAGNPEFDEAYATIRKKLEESTVPEVHDFLATFAPSFTLTLDALNATAKEEK
ncbi:MAG: 5'-deoxynucleotidase [Negativicoccus succinicivorans]|uniref:5'-deoxynucleotidase n=1 Tax=Negativicoccus succinicivorans TaxID=620903 RepID=UPI00290532A3|nr:5'-deoxynucleotidase [Negativicoccus succinicivorans]MDU2095201.1 5'-deoxynucleotidase [Negativicoccus succinicivorans]MDU2417578.1 5'-deoxynucleotidase [Negativicoccus succinicivorans]